MTDNTQTDPGTRRRRSRDIPLPENPSDDELARDWSLSTLDYIEVSRCRGASNRLRFAIQLCVLRKYSRFLASYNLVPMRIVNHLCKLLEMPPTLNRLDEPERDTTEYQYQQRIREYLNYLDYDEKIEADLSAWLTERAIEGMLPDDLYDKAEQTLKSWHVVLPARSTIERLVDSVSARAKEEFYQFISSRLSKKLKKQIDEMLTQTGPDGKTKLFHLKEYPPAASATHILEYLGHFYLVDGMLGDNFETGVELAMQRHLAQVAKRYDAAALRKIKEPNKKYALVACFLAETRKTLLDHIVGMHDQYMTDMARKAKRKNDHKLKISRKLARSGLSTVLDATEIMVDAQIPVDGRTSALFGWITEERLREALNSCRVIERLEDRGLVEQLCAHYSAFKRYFPKFLTLNFECSVGSEPLIDAIKLARSLEADPKLRFPFDAPCHFVPQAWIKGLRKTDGSTDRRVWDIALGVAIRDSLRSGDLHLARSRKHVSFWNLVYDESKWEEQKPKAYAALALPRESADLLSKLRGEYSEAVTKAKAALATNTFVEITDGRLHLKKTDALEIPNSAKQLHHVIETNMRQIRIEDLLQEIDRASMFSREFRPLGGYKPRLKNLYITLLANLIAQGTNLGIAAMSSSVDNVTADMLQHVNQWFFGIETQNAVNATIVNYHKTLSLSSIYGSGELSSSDGQRFGVQQSSLLASFYPRYFGYYDRAISLYTHTSDQYSVFSTQAISCGPREALYVLDGLLNNQTTLSPKEHTTDTHGFTEQLFALCYLLGFSFMPRLADLPDQRLYKFDKTIDMGALEPIFEAPIDLDLIREQWDQLVRVAASLKDKVAPAHVVLHRLVNASPSDRVAKALTALGRLVKTAYLLRYISEPELRRKVQKQLNRGESRHELAKWLFFANRGVFRTGDLEEIMNKASCLSLLSNAVLVWNTIEMEKIIAKLRASGHVIDDADIALFSPLAHRHVVPNGTYFNQPPQKPQSILLFKE